MKLFKNIGTIALVISMPLAAHASIQHSAPVRDSNDLRILPGKYIATDCEDNLRQASPRDNPDYVEQRLTISRSGPSTLHLEHDREAHAFFRNNPAFDRINQGPKEDTETYTTRGGVFKSSRSSYTTTIGNNEAEHTTFLDTWQLETEGYEGAGVVLRAHHINESPKAGETADKSLVCHYARITTR